MDFSSALVLIYNIQSPLNYSFMFLSFLKPLTVLLCLSACPGESANSSGTTVRHTCMHTCACTHRHALPWTVLHGKGWSHMKPPVSQWTQNFHAEGLLCPSSCSVLSQGKKVKREARPSCDAHALSRGIAPPLLSLLQLSKNAPYRVVGTLNMGSGGALLCIL